MSTHSRFPAFQRLWKPAIATGIGGSTLVFWLDEIIMFGESILAVIFLPIMAGVIYLLDIFMFKSRMPRREDMENTNETGAKK